MEVNMNAIGRKLKAASLKRATNISLDSEMIAMAKELGINVSQACERGLAAELKKVREAKWLEENMGAIESWNAWVEKNGLPLAQYRQF
jgi:antitoxin CcdA